MAVYYQTGNYYGECTDLALSEDDNGKATIVLRMRIESQWDHTIADWVAVPNAYERTAYMGIPEEDENRKYVLMKLRHAGWKGTFDTLRDELVGTKFACKCDVKQAKTGKYAGQDKEFWDLPLPPRESTPLENKPAVAKKLNALFGKMLKEGAAPAKPTGKPPAPPKQAPAPEPEQAGVGGGIPSDDIPFAPA